MQVITTFLFLFYLRLTFSHLHSLPCVCFSFYFSNLFVCTSLLFRCVCLSVYCVFLSIFSILRVVCLCISSLSVCQFFLSVYAYFIVTYTVSWLNVSYFLCVYVTDRACACLKSVLRLGMDKDHRTSNWVLILYQTCTTIEMNGRQELQIVYMDV